MRTQNVPGISVVIPCHNASGTLDVCLSALRRSKWPIRECIVVDDASSDGTAEKANSFGATVVRADVEVHEDAITRIMEVLADESVDAVIGAYDDAPAEPSFISQYRNLLHCFKHRRARRNASTFWCGCGAIRRAVLVKRGGLPESDKSASTKTSNSGIILQRPVARSYPILESRLSTSSCGPFRACCGPMSSITPSPGRV